MARTSASDNSRARVTRSTPKLCARRTPSALVTLICVLPWISRSGAICFAMRTMPTSCMMRASAPACGDLRQRVRGFVQFVVEDERIERDVALDAAPVQGRHDLRQFGQRKPHLGARREVFEPEIHGVRAGLDRGTQLWPVSGGTHDFRFTEGGHGTTTFSVASGREYDMAGTINLYQAVGGAEGCRKLSTAFYARVARDPCSARSFPASLSECAIEAFSAFLAAISGWSECRLAVPLVPESARIASTLPDRAGGEGCVDEQDDQGPR